MSLAALAVLATLPAWRDLLYIGWHDEEASQVLLAPFAALWLAWLRRDAFHRGLWQPSWLGPAMLLLATACYVVGDRMHWQALWHLAAVLAMVGAFVAVMGHRVLQRLAPAAAVLLFMAPVPGRIRQAISLPLQEWTAIGGQHIFELLGVYVQRMGNMLVLNDVTIQVEEACNGLRLIFALTLVCYVYAFSVPMRTPARMVLLLASPLLAVVLNTVRLVPTAWVYAHAEPDQAQLFHDITGWLMLPLALGCLILTGMAVAWVRGRSAEAATTTPSSISEPQTVPTTTNDTVPAADADARTRHRWWPIIAALPLLALMPLTEHSAKPDWPEPKVYHEAVRDAIESLPYRIDGWIGTDSPPPPAVGELLKPNVMVSRMYRHLDTGQFASVLLVQSRDARDLAGHYPPVCYPAHGWTPRGESPMHWTLGNGDVPLMQYAYDRDPMAGIPAIVVYDLFALPGVGLTPDMAALRRRGESRHTRAYGAAHWMIVFPADMPAQEHDAAARTFTEAVLPILERVVQVDAGGSP